MAKERKLHIIKAAIKRFTRHGAAKTTLDEIARDLRIGKATIYHYFKSKEDLYFASINFRSDEFAEEIKNIFSNQSKNINEKLLEYFLYKENIQQHYPLIYEVILQLMENRDRDNESKALKYLISKEEEILEKFFSDSFNLKMDEANKLFISFIVIQSWGFLFEAFINSINGTNLTNASHEDLINYCLSKIAN